ncbi:MAG: D-alanyl-D-alanine carboxypeptidase family protein [Dorea sp.]
MITVNAEETCEEPEELYARSAVLMDADSGRILFQKEGRNVLPMASTTKIMTCILALENMTEKQVGTASDYAVSQPKVHLGVQSGEEFYIEDLLYSLMLESHNDSAVIIAEAIAGTVEDFANLMNQKAEEIGCVDTYFITPNGLDAEDEKGIHSTTAADLALIMKYCIRDSPKKDDFLQITQAKSHQFMDVSGQRSFSCNNHNAFLDMMDGALSGKTGFTGDAGYCYVGALKRDDRTFIVALLACGWPNNKTYKWKDTRKLMEYALANYEYRNVWKKLSTEKILVEEAVNEENPFVKNTYVATRLIAEDKKVMALLREDEKVGIKLEQCESLTAPVRKGTKVGKVTYVLNDNILTTFDIVTADNVVKREIQWCFGMLLRKILL